MAQQQSAKRAIQLDGLASFHADRNEALCGKACGGAVCVYVKTEWCTDSLLVSKHCSSCEICDC